MSDKRNPFLLKTKSKCPRWEGLNVGYDTLSTKENDVNKKNERFKVINEREEPYEKTNIFQKKFKSENKERKISKGFLHFTNETKKPEKKPITINIEEMSEAVLNDEFPTLG